jgi:hypothetical protein
MPEGLVSTLVGLVSVLDDLGLAYAVGGSLASSMYGEPRATHDVDLLIDLPPAKLPALLGRLTGEFYVSEDAARRAIETHTSFNLVHLASGHKLDLFVAGSSPLDVLQLETSRLGPVMQGAPPVRVTAPAVIVLRKLSWYRSGGETSERQWRDVVGMLRVQGPALSLDDVRELADELGLSDLLDRAIQEAGRA